MPYPTADIIAAAAADLAGSHPLTLVTIPALLHEGRPVEGQIFNVVPPTIPGFGTRQERPVLEAFRLRDSGIDRI